jgi:hypothetical protein
MRECCNIPDSEGMMKGYKHENFSRCVITSYFPIVQAIGHLGFLRRLICKRRYV